MLSEPLHDRPHEEGRDDRTEADIRRKKEADGHAAGIGRDAADAERCDMVALRCHQGDSIIGRDTKICYIVKRSAEAHEQDIECHEQAARAKGRVRQQEVQQAVHRIGRHARQEQIDECRKANVMAVERSDAHEHDSRQDHVPGAVRRTEHVGNARDKARERVYAKCNLLEYANASTADHDAAECHKPTSHLSLHVFSPLPSISLEGQIHLQSHFVRGFSTNYLIL